MIFRESETLEFKEQYTDNIKKSIVAFLNCNGGKLYVGVRDDGTASGLANTDNIALQISNAIRDTIKPDATMFIHYDTLEVDNHIILAVDIQRGTDRPYYISTKGMRPEGVYVRQGPSSVPASDSAIRQMIKDTDGDSFELMRSLNQELTFDATSQEFNTRNVDFRPQQMRTLDLIDKDGLYTNLALLLSDQCTHTTKVAVFQGSNQNIFKDRREFTGSLFTQMNDVYDFIDYHNQTYSTINRLNRVDTRDYPELALRESLLNMLVHRDYAYSASSIINIFDDRIEFISIGGLVSGIELDDIMAGISICRNEKLANVFYRLQLIEAYGTGMAKIMDSYIGQSQKPICTTTSNTFKITLPNINYVKSHINSVAENSNTSVNSDTLYDLSSNSSSFVNESMVLDYLKSHNQMTRIDAENLIGGSSSKASRLMKKLVDAGVLEKHGNARNTVYTLSTRE